jgi:two-component system, NtrC family, sensor histidine kinase HydH
MNRRILIQVTTPAVVIGLLLFGTCVVSAWYINRLQTNMANIVSQNVSSLQAAHQLEISLRQLRFHSFLYLVDPLPERLQPIEDDHVAFEQALQAARDSSHTPEEFRCLHEIEDGYQRYRADLDELQEQVAAGGQRMDFEELAKKHPIRRLVDPCRELSRLNEEVMHQTAAENAQVSGEAHLAMLLLGLLGPASGLLVGYGAARGLSRSIYQLSVRVQDVAQRLDQDVASVSVAADGDLANLDRHLEHIVHRVEEVAERLHQQQRELLRAEQLSAVGQLAASVAHEVRNPLTAVKLLVESALRSNNRKPLTVEDLQVIHGEVARLEQTVQGFLDFARPPAPRRSRCDLREVVGQAVELVRVRARQQGVEIAAGCPGGPAEALADRGQLCTVLVNLFLNALDAMPRGGRLDVELEASGGELRLAVADTGGGIPPEMQGRLFTPFASSKPTGTGLGLSISRRILEDHGGRIGAENRAEGGARFTITLPAVGEQVFNRSSMAQTG